MPNLQAIISGNDLNLTPDIFLRDYVGDVGDPPTGFVSQSPDIIVRQAAVADPNASYGAGSGTENDPALSEDVVAGHDAFVYVRSQNRGGSAAANVSIDVYWSPPSTLVTPNLWNAIGSVNLPNIPSGNILEVSDAIVWPAASIPATGHYCFVAVEGNAQDQKPGLATFATFDQYITFVENNNNVAWRNFNVVAGPPSAGGSPPGFYAEHFLVAGAFDTSHRFDLEAIGRLPEGSRVFLDVPRWLADSLKPHPGEVKSDSKQSYRIALNPCGLRRLGSTVLHARSRAECVLRVQIPENARKHACEFAVRQMYREREVGRVTWRFAAMKRTQR
jgi:hypothetical protein